MKGEIACLLRHRLRFAALFPLLALVAFLLTNYYGGADVIEPQSIALAVHGLAVVVMAVLTVIVWGPWDIAIGKLRLLEIGVFGTAAAFMAWLHYAWFACGRVLEYAADGQQETVVRLASLATAGRWFGLIVVYGVFIPNTWRRCAAVVGGLALLPILLTAGTALFNAKAGPYFRLPLIDQAIVMGLASGVAIFGTHKLTELHTQAFEAKKLGQYRLGRKLGAGGMGEVYLAEHTLLRRPCAIKIIRAEEAGDPRSLARFRREVQATAALTHWNTIEIFDYGHADDGTFYYVMEYLPGLSLEQLVKHHGPLPPGRAIHLLRQVCAALREAHAVGLTHRDIKPSNVIACERGQVYDVAKLLDFGLVKGYSADPDLVRLTQDGVISGTPWYMSPEQGLGKPDVDARSDIYSLGAVAYQLLTGRPPFERPNPMQVVLAHASEKVVPPSAHRGDLPPDLEAVVLRCLEKEPVNRFPDIVSLDRALAACAAAGDWTPEHAAGWWREHSTTVGPAAEPQSTPVPEAETVPAGVYQEPSGVVA